MKQNFLPARLSVPSRTLATVLIFAILFLTSACITLPLPQSAASTASLGATVEPKPQNNSRVNINSAGAKELEALPGIGEAIAERILEYRAKYGRFRRPEHLMMVRGVSDRKFRELRGLVATE